ncbi:hypothetical protein PPROV_000718200 [Pycnococcus provasolii]|uniref:SET domain-containing protein n=1 Tax=Pycnococcus provasolii TaxID=41880 RepID=A0A830HNZ8_9CHLO|nr:hypothetical protein PPROV_000718200 [Pycnococcus provasolii]
MSVSSARTVLAWLASRGGSANPIHVAVRDDVVRGAFASCDLPRGSVVCIVPDDCVLSAEASKAYGVLKGYRMTEDDDRGDRIEQEALVMAILGELLAGPKSKWSAYLASLPEDVHTLNAWGQRERELLQGTAALEDYRQGETLEEGTSLPHRTAETYLSSGMRDVANDVARHVTRLDIPEHKLRHLYERCVSLVSAFSFTLGKGHHVMVPVWDMLNHVTGQKNVRLRHDAKRRCLEMVTTRHVSEGEELINSYGDDLTPSEIVRRYGYFDTGACDPKTGVHPNAEARIDARRVVHLMRAAMMRHVGAGGAARGGKLRFGATGMQVFARKRGYLAVREREKCWRRRILHLARSGMLPVDVEDAVDSRGKRAMRIRHPLAVYGHYVVRADGSPSAALVETVRVLTMPEHEFFGGSAMPSLTEARRVASALAHVCTVAASKLARDAVATPPITDETASTHVAIAFALRESERACLLACRRKCVRYFSSL